MKTVILCEVISQPKGAHCEIKGLLRNGPSSSKQFRSPIAPLYKKFCSRETPLWHMSAISQPKPPFRSCETIQGHQKLHFPAKAPFCSCKNPCETPIWHMSAISQPTLSFRNCEMGCERGCENGPWLRKWAFAAKCPLLYEKSQPSLGF